MTDLTQIDRVAKAIAQVWCSEDKRMSEESLRQAAILFEPSARAAIEAMSPIGDMSRDLPLLSNGEISIAGSAV
jgi:hypothetical protein